MSRPAAPHLERLMQLLDLEARAAAEQTVVRSRRMSPEDAERSGTALLDLVVDDEAAGLGGRIVWTLLKRNRAQGLPWTRIDVGTPVVLSSVDEGSRVTLRGVVSERTDRFLSVAIKDPPDDARETGPWRLDLADDAIATERQRLALEHAHASKRGRLGELSRVLLGESQPLFEEKVSWAPLDASLNDAQREAVEFALSARDFALVQGPPGTGKTCTVVEIIRQAVRKKEKVLACAPSNMAVDNILLRLVGKGERVVRLGHPARVMSALQEFSLDALVERHEDVRLARRLVREAFSIRRKSQKYTRAKPEPGMREQMGDEARALLVDARRLEARAIERVLSEADILCATTSLDVDLLGGRSFDLVVIDEAAQSTEPGSWVPLRFGDRLVLAGDHFQLPPTIVSPEAARAGLGVSLFERLMLMQADSDRNARRLTVQYRMHERIMEFPSKELYAGSLVADESVRTHCLADLPGVERTESTETPLRFIDTAGAGYDEIREFGGESLENPGEAVVVVAEVRGLLAAGVAAADIAVIAPYAAQVRRLRRELSSLAPGELEVDTVDGFQGREKEAVVISLVRSSADGDVGFLSDIRRMNVALTRARRKLVVIGDSATLSQHPFYARMISHFDARDAYHTVWELS